jgi:ribosomal protein S9
MNNSELNNLIITSGRRKTATASVFMKNEKGEINYYDTEDEACMVCGMYEFENAWVMKLIYNHIEAE